MLILVINPGGGSTKVAVFDGARPVLSETVEHPPNQLVRFGHVLDQYELRKSAVLSVLDQHKFDRTRLQAIATRGGPLRPLPGGVFRITPRVAADIRHGEYQTLHASLLGPLIGFELSQELGIPAYFVDPESTDEFRDIARVSGFNGIHRVAISHALSCRTVAQAAAKKLKKPYPRCRLVVAHLGTGITVAAHVGGKQVDANNANDDGPFSPQRAGSLPLSGVVRACYSGKYTEAAIMSLFNNKGGLLSYFATDDIRKIEKSVAAGNKSAELVYRALIYQIAKEIGAMATAVGGRVDAIVLTGGIANNRYITERLEARVSFLGRVMIMPGEDEARALALGALRVLRGEEEPLTYPTTVEGATQA